jgi:hypothetical protein
MGFLGETLDEMVRLTTLHFARGEVMFMYTARECATTAGK